ncbi:MAG: NYN domain-containing protein [Candidatus Portnoybacteria bacterium]|nr:NYN domain-containing protein [Candidatus Portnoybacteria bacterium]
MIKELNNYAFIDSQNLNLGILSLGWKLDYKKFRVYLREKYKVSKVYLFIGYIPSNQDLYSFLQGVGYVLIFKPTLPDGKGEVKGNIDADLVLQAMIDYKKYDKALIVSSDGDFYSLVKYLYKNNKLKYMMSPYVKTCSILLKKTAKEKIIFMDNLRKKLEYKKKNTAKGQNL